jgi:hypothetical protein
MAAWSIVDSIAYERHCVKVQTAVLAKTAELDCRCCAHLVQRLGIADRLIDDVHLFFIAL